MVATSRLKTILIASGKQAPADFENSNIFVTMASNNLAIKPGVHRDAASIAINRQRECTYLKTKYMN